MNEFAEAGVDDVLLRTASAEVMMIGNGCICCAARSDLNRALRALYADRERGAVPPFTRVVVETSGVSEPVPVLQNFATDRTLTGFYALEGLVTVVDAALAGRTSAREAVWCEQVAMADRIVLTKTDLASDAEADAVRALVAGLNPQAQVLSGAEVNLFAPATARPRPAFACTPHAGAAAPYDSFVLDFDVPFAWPVFTRIMEALCALRGPDLLRVKGFVDVEGCAGPVVVHHVQHLSAPPEELAAWPGGEAQRRTRLVFITRGLSRSAVEGLFAAHLALLAPEPRQLGEISSPRARS